MAILVGVFVALPNPYAISQNPELNPLVPTIQSDLGCAEAEHAPPLLDAPSTDPLGGQTRQKDRDKTKDRQKALSPQPVDVSRGAISGTVTTMNGDVVPGAKVQLHNPDLSETWSTVANDTGAFVFEGLNSGGPYRVTVEARGLEIWKSEDIRLAPGQYFFLTNIHLRFPELVTSVTVYGSTEQIAAQQVILQEKQRVLGFIPNFFVTYDSDPVPLTTKLKFRLAFKANTDPMTFVGVAFVAGMYQAGDMLDYGQGAEGFAKRFGAGYADTTSDIFLGGAILPWLLRQDPRYFYQGTGTKKSRALHALASPYVCRGDNGNRQPNYSSLGGDLASGAISNLYYPESNRGPALVLQGFLITTGVRTLNAVLQEFLIRKLTPSARTRD